jgi:hypothetical protein
MLWKVEKWSKLPTFTVSVTRLLNFSLLKIQTFFQIESNHTVHG